MTRRINQLELQQPHLDVFAAWGGWVNIDRATRERFGSGEE